MMETQTGRRRTKWLLGGGIAAVAAAGLTVGVLASGASAQPGTAAAVQDKGTHAGKGEHRGDRKLGKDESLLVGTVASNSDGKLVVNRDGGGQVTVAVDSSTKFQ